MGEQLGPDTLRALAAELELRHGLDSTADQIRPHADAWEQEATRAQSWRNAAHMYADELAAHEALKALVIEWGADYTRGNLRQLHVADRPLALESIRLREATEGDK